MREHEKDLFYSYGYLQGIIDSMEENVKLSILYDLETDKNKFDNEQIPKITKIVLDSVKELNYEREIRK